MFEVPGIGKTSSLRVCDVLPGNIGLISDLTLEYQDFFSRRKASRCTRS